VGFWNLNRGRQLVTLEDAAKYIQKLPKSEQLLDHWQNAVEALLLVAESSGPTMIARIGVVQAINHGRPAPVSEPRRKRVRAHTIVR
jgi:hypothetical protein